MLAWVFALTMTFSGNSPVFGRVVTIDVTTESITACQSLRKVIVKELTGYGVRADAGVCRPLTPKETP